MFYGTLDAEKPFDVKIYGEDAGLKKDKAINLFRLVLNRELYDKSLQIHFKQNLWAGEHKMFVFEGLHKEDFSGL